MCENNINKSCAFFIEIRFFGIVFRKVYRYTDENVKRYRTIKHSRFSPSCLQ